MKLYKRSLMVGSHWSYHRLNTTVVSVVVQSTNSLISNGKQSKPYPTSDYFGSLETVLVCYF